MNIRGFSNGLQVFKNKNFCFEKWSLMEQNDGWFSHFTLACVRELIHATVGMRNQQNLYPKAPTAVAKLLQYSGLGSNSGMGFLP